MYVGKIQSGKAATGVMQHSDPGPKTMDAFHSHDESRLWLWLWLSSNSHVPSRSIIVGRVGKGTGAVNEWMDGWMMLFAARLRETRRGLSCLSACLSVCVCVRVCLLYVPSLRTPSIGDKHDTAGRVMA